MEKKYYLFDASEKPLGRLATAVARVLSGKNKVDFVPHKDGGDFAVVINSDKAFLSGGKGRTKLYHRFSGYPGGITSVSFEEQLRKDSRKLVWSAVYGMLPKNKLRKGMLKRLLIHKDDKHGQKTVVKQ